MRQRKSLTCKGCNKEFFPISGHLKQQYCSKRCGYLYRKVGGKKGKKYPHLQRARVGHCLVCGKEYRAVKDFKNKKQKYCSRKCYATDWLKKIRPIMRKCTGLKGELNPSWRGDDVGYGGLHRWVKKHLGKKMECKHCGSTDKKKYEWANKDHKYKRDLNDWIRLCTSCHRKYDFKVNPYK